MTENEFDKEMSAAKQEKARALKVVSVNKARGKRVTEYNLHRIDVAQNVIDQLMYHEIFVARILTRKAEKRALKQANKKRYYEKNREKVKQAARTAYENRKANGKNAAYLEASRERRNELKAKYRREAGATPLSVLREERKRRDENLRVAKAEFVTNFSGPPKPSQALSPARYYQWRVTNDAEFYAKELDRSQRYKVRTRPGYRPSVVEWSAMPKAIKEVKHITYRIAREINRREANEDYQRTA